MTYRILIIWIFLFINSISCKKDKYENNYCVNNISDTPNRAILTDTDLKTIKSLFDHNNLIYSNYQFYELQIDELGYHHVRCFQYINNLKLFTNDLIFHFNQNDSYCYLSGDLINGINLDTKPKMIQNKVIDLFINEINKDNNYFDSKDELIKGCFDIEFGYYDLNAGTESSINIFTKAWFVKPKGKEYPIAYIDDSHNRLIGYSDGIISIK